MSPAPRPPSLVPLRAWQLSYLSSQSCHIPILIMSWHKDFYSSSHTSVHSSKCGTNSLSIPSFLTWALVPRSWPLAFHIVTQVRFSTITPCNSPAETCTVAPKCLVLSRDSFDPISLVWASCLISTPALPPCRARFCSPLHGEQSLIPQPVPLPSPHPFLPGNRSPNLTPWPNSLLPVRLFSVLTAASLPSVWPLLCPSDGTPPSPFPKPPPTPGTDHLLKSRQGITEPWALLSQLALHSACHRLKGALTSPAFLGNLQQRYLQVVVVSPPPTHTHTQTLDSSILLALLREVEGELRRDFSEIGMLLWN